MFKLDSTVPLPPPVTRTSDTRHLKYLTFLRSLQYSTMSLSSFLLGGKTTSNQKAIDTELDALFQTQVRRADLLFCRGSH